MDSSLFTPTSAQTSEAESLSYVFKELLSGAFFIELVEVMNIQGEAPDLVVDVIPLVTRTDPSGATIQNSEIFNVPVFRLQRGGSAIIMNPVIGDIGMIAICDRDNSIARANRRQSVPGSKRTHSKSDALYLGGFLNNHPSQFIEFADGSINITSPNPVNITCSKANIIAPEGVDMTTSLLHVIGGGIKADKDITDNADSQPSTVKQLRDAYNAHDHDVVNVQGGSSTITSNATDNQV
ncbi:phage baseplate protein [Yersinia enterocolitica]|uniref:phage baseplate protein n=2 Tax=Yersinia enterocolitica TaxID=630 RepID=UPI0005DCB9EB|nr:phage baseplate protein [Yersinia enterocolitica]CND01021.1 Mu Gp45 domain-containing protein [Yersinia frederiksenii]EKN3779552.1 phage baseplate protein [Yersinia enterocolitica]EKN4095960.1 phage baseplate protein [Yersinia enterocolitica]EKN4744842.1 phage baseplate protein [Yersinia enterocolitica]EKN4745555.1 phage baseplate protein [Yersinia enterocolitica]